MIYTSYLVPCITEGKPVVTDYLTEKPTCCPNNISHVISAGGIRAVNVISPPTPVTVDQSSGLSTNKQYRVDCYTIVCGNETKIKYPYNVNVHTITFLPNIDNIGISLDCGIEDSELKMKTIIQNLYIINTDDICFGLSRLSSIPVAVGNSLSFKCSGRNNTSVIQFYLEIEY